MSKKHNIVLDHTPTNIRFDSWSDWLDYVLIAAEETGRKKGFFNAESPYNETYQRPLTPKQRSIRAIVRSL